MSTAPERFMPSSTGRASRSRCTTERLTLVEGLRRIPREKTRRTTIGAGAETERPEDKVKRKLVTTARTSCAAAPPARPRRRGATGGDRRGRGRVVTSARP